MELQSPFGPGSTNREQHCTLLLQISYSKYTKTKEAPKGLSFTALQALILFDLKQEIPFLLDKIES